ncbi:hypothetical protein [Asaia astilbis]|nr:hypothetical protein [Asaia astilbis]
MPREIGSTAANLLSARLKRPDLPRERVVMAPRLILRDSA